MGKNGKILKKMSILLVSSANRQDTRAIERMLLIDLIGSNFTTYNAFAQLLRLRNDSYDKL